MLQTTLVTNKSLKTEISKIEAILVVEGTASAMFNGDDGDDENDNALRESRLKKGLTQKELADKVGKSPSYILRMEKGENVGMELDTARKLSKILNVAQRDFPSSN